MPENLEQHTDAIQLISEDYQADRDNINDGLEDLKFLAGDQWEQGERARREREDRPCLTIPHLNKFVNQVAGEIRQGQFGIEVFPVDDQEDVAISNIYQGLIRQIEYQSNAQAAYVNGGEGAVRCGIGHWRISTDFTADSPFEQEIKFERILDPLSVIWDADAVKIDRSDAKRCWVTQWLHKSAWKRDFPAVERQLSDVPIGAGLGGDSDLFWRRDDFVRIAEYWRLVPEDRTFVMLVTGQTLDITDWSDIDLAKLRMSGMIIDERKAKAFKVKRRIMDGVDWLDKQEAWAGQYIPIVPVLGSEVAFDGKIVRKGLIRDAKDAQKLLNYWRSAAAEMVGKQPKSPWQGTQTMFAGLEGYYAAANRSNVPILPYNIDANAPAGAMPKRTDPPQIPTAMLQEAQLAVEDMKATTGIFDPSLGDSSNETSGRAILARQRQGSVGAFVFTDNFAAAMKRTGQILVDLIPRIYDTERQIRILQPDDTEQYVPINVKVMDASGEELLVNDLSNRRFDVRVKIGASYTTARVEAREQMATAMQTNPALWQVFGDLFFKNSDHPGADEIAARIRRTIPKELLEDQPDEPPPDPMADVVTRLQIAGQEATIAKDQATAMKSEADAQKSRAQTAQTVAQTEQTEAETDGQEIENEANMQSLELVQ